MVLIAKVDPILSILPTAHESWITFQYLKEKTHVPYRSYLHFVCDGRDGN
jgi:hypothetical protein